VSVPQRTGGAALFPFPEELAMTIRSAGAQDPKVPPATVIGLPRTIVTKSSLRKIKKLF